MRSSFGIYLEVRKVPSKKNLHYLGISLNLRSCLKAVLRKFSSLSLFLSVSDYLSVSVSASICLCLSVSLCLCLSLSLSVTVCVPVCVCLCRRGHQILWSRGYMWSVVSLPEPNSATLGEQQALLTAESFIQLVSCFLKIQF